jgi:hypothetical protein
VLIPTAAARVPGSGTGTDLALRVAPRPIGFESHELELAIGGSVGVTVDCRLVQGVLGLLAPWHTGEANDLILHIPAGPGNLRVRYDEAGGRSTSSNSVRSSSVASSCAAKRVDGRP